MQMETPPHWVETSTLKSADETRSHLPTIKTHGRHISFYNTLYRTQHVDKQMKHGLLAKIQWELVMYRIKQVFC